MAFPFIIKLSYIDFSSSPVPATIVVSEVIFAITSAVKDVCAKLPSERLFLDKYGRICLCLDEIVWKVGRQLLVLLLF
jgi:hypothetical protein